MNISYKRTLTGCFAGTFTMAVITNLTALLFVPMMDLYGFDYRHLGILVAVNFVTQVAADFSFSGVIDKVGYRRLLLPACLIAACGLMLFAASPFLFKSNVFAGILVATVIFSFSSGLFEIMLSPIIAAVPTDNKGPLMSLMHSLYAWTQVVTIIVTTLLVGLLGGKMWPVIAIIWSVVPLCAFFVFFGAPMPDVVSIKRRMSLRELFNRPFFVFSLFAIFFGAGAEIVMNQFASAFMEKGLGLPKITGDLFGMCGFAVMLGLGRLLYGVLGKKADIHRIMIIGSAAAVLCYFAAALCPWPSVSVLMCVLCGFAVSLLWPGTITISSGRFPLAGARMFAILAAFGDIGGSSAPWMTGELIDGVMDSGFVASFSAHFGIAAEQGALRAGICTAALFPLGALVCHIILSKIRHSDS